MRIASFATFFCLLSYQVDAHCFYPDGSFDHVLITCNPTAHPTTSPSGIPSAHPTTSPAPSTSPTDLPSESPTQNPSFSPSLSPSDSPTGSIFVTVADVEFSIHNVTGEQEMSPQNIQYFEGETTLYLRNQIQEAPGAFRIEVENVLVKDQNLVVQDNGNSFSENDPKLHDPFLRRRRRLEESQTNLIITIDVVVSVVLNRSENLELNELFNEFFEMPEHENELLGILEQEKSFFQELFVKGAIPSSKATSKEPSKASSKEPSKKPSKEPSKESSKASAKKASNGTAVIGTVMGVLAMIVGSGLLWMWMKTRQTGARQSNDSGKIKSVGTISRSFESDDRRGGRTKEKDSAGSKGFKKSRNDQFVDTDYIDNEYDKDDQSSSQLMYIRTIMRTESNIEVPDTPQTAFAVNGFATPASVNGFMSVPGTPQTAFAVNGFATPASANGFMTPASTKSRGVIANSPVVLPKLLGDVSPDHKVISAIILKDIDSSTKQKLSLPPKILGSLKSPFRRGPGVEENRLPRPHLRRHDKKHSRAPRPGPPMVIGGPPNTGHSVANSTKTKDDGVIDIVDEIAYLYSTNSEPDKYKDGSSNN